MALSSPSFFYFFFFFFFLFHFGPYSQATAQDNVEGVEGGREGEDEGVGRKPSPSVVQTLLPRCSRRRTRPDFHVAFTVELHLVSWFALAAGFSPRPSPSLDLTAPFPFFLPLVTRAASPVLNFCQLLQTCRSLYFARVRASTRW